MLETLETLLGNSKSEVEIPEASHQVLGHIRRYVSMVDPSITDKRVALGKQPKWVRFDDEDGSGRVDSMRPHQLDGVGRLIWICEQTHAAVLADDMGLGKTLEMLLTVVLHRERLEVQYDAGAIDNGADKPTLILVPSGVMTTWKDEISARLAPGTVRCKFLDSVKDVIPP